MKDDYEPIFGIEGSDFGSTQQGITDEEPEI